LSVGTANITEPSEITVDIGETRRVVFGDTVMIEPMVDGDYGIVEYIWEPYDSTWMSCSDCLMLDIYPSFQRDLFLTVIDENGCTGEAYIQVQVTKNFPLEVPTGFTPNGDGANDRLLVHGLPGVQVSSFRIWDRWGEQIFEEFNFMVNDPNIGWDGTYREEAMNSGVYLWQVEALLPDGGTTVVNGQVMLIR
ncbi:MAG: gliding motility-associated C-terminal domain-containing protein, partial [Bacteroidota bacterium]